MAPHGCICLWWSVSTYTIVSLLMWLTLPKCMYYFDRSTTLPPHHYHIHGPHIRQRASWHLLRCRNLRRTHFSMPTHTQASFVTMGLWSLHQFCRNWHTRQRTEWYSWAKTYFNVSSNRPEQFRDKTGSGEARRRRGR